MYLLCLVKKGTARRLEQWNHKEGSKQEMNELLNKLRNEVKSVYTGKEKDPVTLEDMIIVNKKLYDNRYDQRLPLKGRRCNPKAMLERICRMAKKPLPPCQVRWNEYLKKIGK